MPRFVILAHDYPSLHWDFMLERGESLQTWRLAQSPDADGLIDAEAITEHRLAYLEYEGPVSGDRGEVKRWDIGSFQAIESNPMRVIVRLAGERLRGDVSLERPSLSSKWFFQRLKTPLGDIED